VDFSKDPSALRVQAPAQTFLHTYVVNSVKERIVLGPEERAMVRTVSSAYSVIEVWRRLIASSIWTTCSWPLEEAAWGAVRALPYSPP
jgi:hypothetical protein